MSTPKSLKRKRTVVTLETKVEIIRRLEKNESQSELARQYNLGKSTISEIYKQKEKILEFVSKLDSLDGSKQRKTMKNARHPQLDEALYMWFIQRRLKKDPVSGTYLHEKALEFNTQLGGPPQFQASDGFVSAFKSRHGIRELDLLGEKSSANESSAEQFKLKFKNIMKNYSLDDVYNCDETGLLWKALPRKSLVTRKEKTAPGFKASKERVTILVGANASGKHRLPLLMIGKSAKPRCFKNVQIPINYTNQKSAWMSGEIFINWFSNDFIPSVKKFRKDNKLTGPVLLILDNAPTHPSEDILNKIDESFKVCFLPPNVTALLQPMDQGVIEKMKRIYRKLLLRMLLSVDNEESLIDFCKKINLKDCSYMIAEAWSLLTEDNLKRAWNKIFGKEGTNVEAENLYFQEIIQLFQELLGFSDCDLNDAEEWMQDDVDPGYEILSDSEIIAAVQHEEEDEEFSAEEQLEDLLNKPSHEEARTAVETLISWYEQEPDFSLPKMLLLRNMHDQVILKQNASLKQKKISDYFK